jgi:hypothetical protein
MKEKKLKYEKPNLVDLSIPGGQAVAHGHCMIGPGHADCSTGNSATSTCVGTGNGVLSS